MKNKRRIIGILAATILASSARWPWWATCSRRRTRRWPKRPWSRSTSSTSSCPRAAEPRRSRRRSRSSRSRPGSSSPVPSPNLDDVGDNVAATDLQPGDQLLAARLVPKDQVSEEVTTRCRSPRCSSAERAVGGALEKGDLVGVYLSFDPFETRRGRTEPRQPTDGTADDGGRPANASRRPKRPKPTHQEDAERDPAGVPARARHQRADDQRAGRHRQTTMTTTSHGIAQVTGRSTSSRSPCRPSSRSASCSPPSSATCGCRTSRPPSPTTAHGWSPSATSTRW